MLKHTISPLTYKKKEKKERKEKENKLYVVSNIYQLYALKFAIHTPIHEVKTLTLKHLDVLGKWNYDSK